MCRVPDVRITVYELPGGILSDTAGTTLTVYDGGRGFTGPTGPQGPAGDTGPQGPAGPDPAPETDPVALAALADHDAADDPHGDRAAAAADATGKADAAQAAAVASSAQRASNLADLADAAAARTSLGLGTAATESSTLFDPAGAADAAQAAAIAASAQRAANLADLASAATARTNLGLGTAATTAAAAYDTAGAAGAAQTAATTAAAADATSKVAAETAARAAADALLETQAHASGTYAALTVGGKGVVRKDELVINVKDYGAVGNGTTDDTAAILSALNTCTIPGYTVVFPPPSVRYKITGALAVKAGTRVQGAGRSACEIRQHTAQTPVFDVFDADGVTVDGFHCSYSGNIVTDGMGGSTFRGNMRYAYAAAVYSNSNQTTVRNVLADGFQMGFNYSHWTTVTSSFSGFRSGGVIENVECNGVNHGILLQGQDGLTVNGLNSHDHVNSSGISSGTIVVNPTHAIYVTGDAALFSQNITVTNCVSKNNAYGCAYQFKYVTGGTFSNLTSINCAGVFNGLALQDCAVSNVIGSQCSSVLVPTGGATGAFSLQDGTYTSTRVTMSNIFVEMLASERVVSLWGTDCQFSNFITRSRRTSSGDYDVVLRGTNSRAAGFFVVGTSSSNMPAAGLTMGYTTGAVNCSVTNLRTINCTVPLRVDGASTGCSVDPYLWNGTAWQDTSSLGGIVTQPPSAVPSNKIVTSLGNSLGALAAGFAQGSAVPTANDTCIVRFTPDVNFTCGHIKWACNVQSGNYDIGILSVTGTLLWSKGSTAMPAAGAVTEVVSPGVPLVSGTSYYFALAIDNTTGKAYSAATTISGMFTDSASVSPCLRVASTFPIATLTPGVTVSSRPFLGVFFV